MGLEPSVQSFHQYCSLRSCVAHLPCIISTPNLKHAKTLQSSLVFVGAIEYVFKLCLRLYHNLDRVDILRNARINLFDRPYLPLLIVRAVIKPSISKLDIRPETRLLQGRWSQGVDRLVNILIYFTGLYIFQTVLSLIRMAMEQPFADWVI